MKSEAFWAWWNSQAKPKLAVRADTFKAMFEHLDSFDRPVQIIETGAYGWEKEWKHTGASTLQWNKYLECRNDGSQCWSIEINWDVVQATQKLCPHVNLICNESVAQLMNHGQWLPGKVDLLYLDSGFMDWEEQHIAQQHHLAEFRAIQPALHERSLVAVDDSMLLPSNEIGGRAGALARMLAQMGAKGAFLGYQIGFIGCVARVATGQPASAPQSAEPVNNRMQYSGTVEALDLQSPQ